jgi:hypothetical protein
MADPLIVKICGIKTPELLEAAIDAGADMVGFMHFERSPRMSNLETLTELISQARGRVETCVVLVNPDNSSVMEIAADETRPDAGFGIFGGRFVAETLMPLILDLQALRPVAAASAEDRSGLPRPS